MKTGISSPWVGYYRKIEALFGPDPEIKTKFEDGESIKKIKIYVDNQKKAEALTKILPQELMLGGATVYIDIIPSNFEEEKTSIPELILTAFDGNPIFDTVIGIKEVFTNPITYVMFKKKVAQYYDDDLGDPEGNRSCLYQDLAKEVLGKLENNGIFYCTSSDED